MKLTDLGKYFGPKPGGKPGFTLFDIEPCDNCGADMSSPNTLTCYDPKEKIISLGGTYRDEVPGEGYLTDDGDVVCEDCYS